jgi:hypothetical protein
LICLVAATLRDHHNKRRKVLILTTDAIAYPKPQTWSAGLLATRLQKGDRWVMIDILGLHAADNCDAIGQLREMGH